jgi:hypothetical protein
MRILEYTPIQFLGKARLISKEFKGMVDQFSTIYINCRFENYGPDMPPPPPGLSERQYSNLLGTKGCLEPGCADKNAARTHWSWSKRWCSDCWKSKIQREDRLLKSRGDRFPSRLTLVKLLECIPVGMHDSFMKPHDYEEGIDNRPRGAPRLYKYYLTEDVDRIFAEYDALTPTPHVDDPAKTSQENATALQIYQAALAALDNNRAEFLATRKAKIDEHMAMVQKIEGAVRKRREINKNPNDANRAARKELFTRRAREQLPHIPEEFVQGTIAYKAACRIFRDPGSERGWQTLKPKIQGEWETSLSQEKATSINRPQLDGADDTDDAEQTADDVAGPNRHSRRWETESDMERVLRESLQSDTDIDFMEFDSPQPRSQQDLSHYGRSEAEAASSLSSMSRISDYPTAQHLHPHITSMYGGMCQQSSYPSSTGFAGMGYAPLPQPQGLSTAHRGNGGMPAMLPSLSIGNYPYITPPSHAGTVAPSTAATSHRDVGSVMHINNFLNTNPSASPNHDNLS